MPRIQQIGPPSTPRLYFEDQYKMSQQQISQRYQNLQQRYQGQQIDYESALKEHADLQAEADGLTETFQSTMRMMQQSQKFVDLGIISPEENQEAMWAQVLPRELHEKMYPKPATESQRGPLSPQQLEAHVPRIEEFATSGKPTKKKWGIDRLARDVHTKKSLMKQYSKWKVNIGYDANMTSGRQRQVDSEWDAWVIDKYGKELWNPESKEILAARGKGPLTRGYGSRAKGTPLGSREAGDPIQSSIAAALPKKRGPKKRQETAEELRKKNTPEAYELGRQLGYWN